MIWLRLQICKWLYPVLIPALDDCNKRNLVNYYKSQNDFQQEVKTHNIAVSNWMESYMESLKSSDDQHKENIERFDRLIDILARGLPRTKLYNENECTAIRGEEENG